MKIETPPKLVLTGGPCAGKSTMAELIARAYQHTVVNLPEAASLLFSGGFPRFSPVEAKRAVQRAIYYTQVELEAAYAAQFSGKSLVLDRGTVDGAAYWPDGPEAFFREVHSSLEAELARYQCVIYLESVDEKGYELHKSKNPNRREDWKEARRLDQVTRDLWSRHPSFIHIPSQHSFPRKVSEVLAAVAGNLGVGADFEKI